MVDVGFVVHALAGETVSGDRVEAVRDETSLLVAVIDGLGHGPPAAAAAAAAGALVTQSPKLPLVELVQRCGRALVGTRGVAMTVVRLDLPTLELTHVGVGNVELVAASRVPVRPFSRAGIVGASMPRLSLATYRLEPGDTVAMFSDGVSARFSLTDHLVGQRTARELAEDIVRAHGRGTDDACCAVIRC
jgi:hypothetical protein